MLSLEVTDEWERYTSNLGKKQQQQTTNLFYRPFSRTTQVSWLFQIFMWPQEVLLTIPPCTDAVLNSTGWYASRKYYKNSTLVSRCTVNPTTPRFDARCPSCRTLAWGQHQSILVIYPHGLLQTRNMVLLAISGTV